MQSYIEVVCIDGDKIILIMSHNETLKNQLLHNVGYCHILLVDLNDKETQLAYRFS
jgi:hypothetical protein